MRDDGRRDARRGDANVLGYLNEIEKQMPENVFASAIIGAPYMVSVFMDIMMKMRPHAQRVGFFTKTREEAHTKIRERYQQANPTAGTPKI